MSEIQYVITADIINRHQDGLDPEDGSPVYRSYRTRKTWSFPANTPIGNIMERVNSDTAYTDNVIEITVTEDRVSAMKTTQERIAEAKARQAE